jgi:hypothetical protein
LKPRRLTIEEFPGFSCVLLSSAKMDIIVAQGIESWESALSSVAGVYLITDTKTGRHYVGTANIGNCRVLLDFLPSPIEAGEQRHVVDRVGRE